MEYLSTALYVYKHKNLPFWHSCTIMIIHFLKHVRTLIIK